MRERTEPLRRVPAPLRSYFSNPPLRYNPLADVAFSENR